MRGAGLGSCCRRCTRGACGRPAVVWLTPQESWGAHSPRVGRPGQPRALAHHRHHHPPLGHGDPGQLYRPICTHALHNPAAFRSMPLTTATPPPQPCPLVSPAAAVPFADPSSAARPPPAPPCVCRRPRPAVLPGVHCEGGGHHRQGGGQVRPEGGRVRQAQLWWVTPLLFFYFSEWVGTVEDWMGGHCRGQRGGQNYCFELNLWGVEKLALI